MNKQRPVAIVIFGLVLAGLSWWLLSGDTSLVPSKPKSSATNSPVLVPAGSPASTGTGTNKPSLGPTVATTTSSRTRAEALAPIERFTDWLAQWRQSNGSARQGSIARGRELATSRRAALKHLIALDPKAALEHAVPRSLRAELPPEVIAQLETPIDTFGKYQVLSACFGPDDRTERWLTIDRQHYDAYTYGRRLASLSKNRLAVHGIAVDGDLALAELPYRRLESTELASLGNPTSAVMVAVGDSIKAFASEEELQTWAARNTAAEALPGPDADLRDQQTAGLSENVGFGTAAATSTAWTTGNKKVLVIRVDFSDLPGDPQHSGTIYTAAQCQGLMDTVIAPYFAQSSFGQTSLTSTVTTQLYRMPLTGSYYATNGADSALHNDARAAASANYPVATYDRIIVLFSNLGFLPGSQVLYGGLGDLGGSSVWANGQFNFRVVAHELGHTYGLSHAGLWKVTDGNPISSSGNVDQYGDDFDTMGGNSADDSHTDFNPQFKNLLGWMADSQVLTVTTSGTYRINRFDNSTGTGTLALKVNKDSAKNYWIGIRRNFPANTYMANGAYVILGYNNTQSADSVIPGIPGSFQSELLDLGTPGAAPATGQASDYDAALAPGQTFTDPDAGIHFTVVANGGTAPNEFADVRVDFGAMGNNHNPIITAVTPAGNLDARSDITFTLAGSDPDGDTVYYRWDFGDGLIEPASTATVTHRWLKGGAYTVRVSALDGKGGLATTSLDVAINDPLLSWTQRANGLAYGPFADVIYAANRFVATGSTTAASPDGMTWTLAPMPGAQISNGIAYGGGRYVAVGERSVSGATVSSASYSTDGVTWNLGTLPLADGFLQKVAYGAGRFVAVGEKMYTSADGMTWTEVTNGVAGYFSAIRYAEGLFVAAGSNGSIVTSPDGLAWSNRMPSTSTAYFSGVARFNGSWYVSSAYETWTSSDAVSWKEIRAPADQNTSINGLGLGLGMLFALRQGGVVSFTQDAKTWTNIMPSGSRYDSFFGLAEGRGTVVIVGTSGLIYQTLLPPLITTQPASQTVTVGNSVAFTVSASGTETPSYQWQKGGVSIVGATSSTYTIGTTSATDAGDYSVVVSNAAGSVTSVAATLAVGIPPAGFDVAGYFSRNPAEAALFGANSYAAWLHYRDHGIYDGEVFDDLFRVEEYLTLYPELFAVFGSDLGGALMHWLNEGRIEGRLGRIPLEFSATGYLTRNPDVATAVNNDPLLAWSHYWLYGIYEGRAYDDELRVFEYLAVNADLTAAFVTDWRAAALHWMRYGRTEGRLGRLPLTFNVSEYLVRSPDVAVVWGTNPTTVFLHYWIYGIDENRTYDDLFRPDQYLVLNPDLHAALGTDRRLAFKHWVRYGMTEGRPGKNP